MKYREPQTPEEWQDAVDAAEFCMGLESCKQYGLITCPKVNIRRCQSILDRGRARGCFPKPFEQLISRFVEGSAA